MEGIQGLNSLTFPPQFSYRYLSNNEFLDYGGSGGSNYQVVAVTQSAVAETPKVEAKPDDSPASVIKLGEFSAYNAEIGQTDADPRTMANGKEVYDGAIANNCLSFGTKVKVGEKIYTVADRMNKRYTCDHFDIFFDHYEDAITFGRKQLEYSIIN